MNNLESSLALHASAVAQGQEFRGPGTLPDLNYQENLADKFHRGDDCRPQEVQALSNQAIDEQRAAYHWGQVAALLIRQRETIRVAVDPDSLFVAKGEKHLEVLGMAASALGPSIAIAIENQRRHNANLEAIREKLPPPPRGYTAITNIEMDRELAAEKDAKRAVIAKDGCCGGTPMPDGVCFGIGMCPRHLEANSAVKFCERLVAWTDDLDSERVASELRDSIPLTIGESHE